MTPGTKTTFMSRMRTWPVHKKLIDLTCWSAPATLLVVAGESGSGKTHGALLLHDPSYIVLYMTHADLANFWWDDWKVQNSVANGTMTTKDRDEQALSVLLKVLDCLVPTSIQVALRRSDATKPAGFALVVDEVGGAPQMLRALCALQLNDEEKGNCSLGFLDDYPLRVVAVGTGVDALVSQVGFPHETYTLVHMPSARTMWEAIVNDAAMQATVGRRCKMLSTALSRMGEYWKAADLATNARLAVLIAIRTDAAVEAIAEAAGRLQLQQLMDQVLHAAATEFRSLNSLSTIDRNTLSAALSRAVRLVMTHATSPGQSKWESDQTQRFCTTYGFLTDHAEWVTHLPVDSNCHSSTCLVLLEDAGHFLIVRASEDGCFNRFRMSPAQLTLLHMMYGFNLPPASGVGEFELLVARYLELVLIACRGEPVEALLRRIGMNGGPSDATAPMYGVLAYDRVVLVKTPPLSPSTPLEALRAIMTELAAEVQKGCAVVAFNGDQAHFADVLLMIPRQLLLLVQCKYDGKNTAWTEYDAYVELHKMGAVDHCSLVADEVRRLSLAAAKASYPTLCGADMEQVPRQEIFNNIVGKRLAAAADGACATAAAELVERLSKLVGEGTNVPVRRCLFTTKPTLPLMPEDVLQKEATETALWPLKLRGCDDANRGPCNDVVNRFESFGYGH